NFIQEKEDGLHVRTWERGVEAETYACGTGCTASAISAYKEGLKCCTVSEDGTIKYTVKTLKDTLAIDFKEDLTNVYLTGPATFVFETEFELD
ncbi:MAG: diaminopimelate epimerase, partial [Bacteroidales bacterium]|nr:diaminopimelate epimerase [Bacteroidales bacterium]